MVSFIEGRNEYSFVKLKAKENNEKQDFIRISCR